jgi:phosphate ABC transporter phosphate-binding protein
MPGLGRRRPKRRHLFAWLAAAFVGLLPLPLGTGTAGAASYVPIAGEGSSWSANAINQWIADTHQFGMRVSYTPDGSSAGRQAYINGTTDFAGSDIPFQTHSDDGSAPEGPVPPYAYMPDTSGGTTFMYNLLINGQRVTNLRLSGQNIAKIFTGVITNWNDPALTADNPGLRLPNRQIVPVVRSDGSGSTAQFTLWMISQYPGIWNAYCQRSGRAPACGETSYYPTIPGMVAQAGDLGVAGYIAQGFAQGAIGYVEYSYAKNAGFPVAKMLNAAGYYTEPTPDNVAVSLLKAQVDTTDVNDPSKYLTQNLSQVYPDPDPRTYPLSSYSYMILPTKVEGQFSMAKGNTLAAFSYYAMCQGQQESGSLGYSPMPINLVEAAFQQIRKIPGAVVQNINIQSCHNPTFTANGTNLLADDAPFPPACDKKGPTQCTTGTGGAAKQPTVLSNGTAGSSGGAGASSSGGGGSGGSGGAAGGTGTATSAGGRSAGTRAANGALRGTSATACNPDTGSCTGSSGANADSANNSSGGSGLDASAQNTVLAARSGWTSTQTLMVLAGLLFLAIIIVPGLVARRLGRTK